MTVFPNWFDQVAKSNFQHFLKDYAGKENLFFVQIGAFTGDATIWLLDNILTKESSRLVDVDTWRGSDEEEHKKMDFDEVHQYYCQRTEGYSNLYVAWMESSRYLPVLEEGDLDFIYIDGNHTSEAVREDAKHAWRATKSGGIIAFDDYLWTNMGTVNETCPRYAIDEFLEEHKDDIEILEKGYQVWVRKK